MNLFKKAQQVTHSLAASFQQPVDTQEIIMQIHDEFETASDKILKQAKEILGKPLTSEIKKGERLSKLGFNASKPAVNGSSVLHDRHVANEEAKCVEYFSQHYPNNKFITEGLVKIICEKYGLVFGEASYYIGDVPEKNVDDIENFVLRQEDKVRYECRHYTRDTVHYYYHETETGLYGYLKFSRSWGGRYLVETAEDVKEVFEQPEFRICGPEKDFDMRNLEKVGHTLQVKDPVVLQPVSGGYLIVSKWGLEADDALLMNEKMN